MFLSFFFFHFVAFWLLLWIKTTLGGRPSSSSFSLFLLCLYGLKQHLDLLFIFCFSFFSSPFPTEQQPEKINSRKKRVYRRSDRHASTWFELKMSPKVCLGSCINRVDGGAARHTPKLVFGDWLWAPLLFIIDRVRRVIIGATPSNKKYRFWGPEKQGLWFSEVVEEVRKTDEHAQGEGCWWIG